MKRWYRVMYVSYSICEFSISLRQKLQTFSVEGQIVNILGSVGLMVSVTAVQLCHHKCKNSGHKR